MTNLDELWRAKLHESYFSQHFPDTGAVSDSSSDPITVSNSNQNIHLILRMGRRTHVSSNGKPSNPIKHARSIKDEGRRMLIEYARHNPSDFEKPNLARLTRTAINTTDDEMKKRIHALAMHMKKGLSDKVEEKRLRLQIAALMINNPGQMEGQRPPDFKALYHSTVQHTATRLVATPSFMTGVTQRDLNLVTSTASSDSAPNFNTIAKDIFEHVHLYEQVVRVFTQLTAFITDSCAEADDGTDDNLYLGLGLGQYPKFFENPFVLDRALLRDVVKLHETFVRLSPPGPSEPLSKPGTSEPFIPAAHVLLMCAEVSEYLMPPRGASKVVYCMYPNSVNLAFVLAVEDQKPSVNYTTSSFLTGMSVYVKHKGCSRSYALTAPIHDAITRVEPYWVYGFPISLDAFQQLRDAHGTEASEPDSFSPQFTAAIREASSQVADGSLSLEFYDTILDAVTTPEDALFIEYLSQPIRTNNWTGAAGVPLSSCMTSINSVWDTDELPVSRAAEMCGMENREGPCAPPQRTSLPNESCKWSALASSTAKDLNKKILAGKNTGLCRTHLCELLVNVDAWQPATPGSIKTGGRVRVSGLQDRTELNGSIGTFQSVLADGRGQVKLDAGKMIITPFAHIFTNEMCSDRVLDAYTRKVRAGSRPVDRRAYNDMLQTINSEMKERDKTCADEIHDECVARGDPITCFSKLEAGDDRNSAHSCREEIRVSKAMTVCKLLVHLSSQEKDESKVEFMNNMSASLRCTEYADNMFSFKWGPALKEQWEKYKATVNIKVERAYIEKFMQRAHSKIMLLMTASPDADSYDDKLLQFKVQHEETYEAFIQFLTKMLRKYFEDDKNFLALDLEDTDDDDDGDDDNDGDPLQGRVCQFMLQVCKSLLFERDGSGESLRPPGSLCPFAVVVLFESMQKHVRGFAKLAHTTMKSGRSERFANELLILSTHSNGYSHTKLNSGMATLLDSYAKDIQIGNACTFSFVLDLALKHLQTLEEPQSGLERELLALMFSQPPADENDEGEQDINCGNCETVLANCFDAYADTAPALLDFVFRFYFYVNFLNNQNRTVYKKVRDIIKRKLKAWITTKIHLLDSIAHRDLTAFSAWLTTMGIQQAMQENSTTQNYHQALARLMSTSTDSIQKGVFSDAHRLLLQASFIEYAISHKDTRAMAQEDTRAMAQGDTHVRTTSTLPHDPLGFLGDLSAGTTTNGYGDMVGIVKATGLRIFKSSTSPEYVRFVYQGKFFTRFKWPKMKHEWSVAGQPRKKFIIADNGELFVSSKFLTEDDQRNILALTPATATPATATPATATPATATPATATPATATANPNPNPNPNQEEDPVRVFSIYKEQMKKDGGIYSRALLLNLRYTKEDIRLEPPTDIRNATEAIKQLTSCILLTAGSHPEGSHADALVLFELFRIVSKYKGFDKMEESLQFRVVPSINDAFFQVTDGDEGSQATFLKHHALRQKIRQSDRNQDRYITSKSREKKGDGQISNEFYYEQALERASQSVPDGDVDVKSVGVAH